MLIISGLSLQRSRLPLSPHVAHNDRSSTVRIYDYKDDDGFDSEQTNSHVYKNRLATNDEDMINDRTRLITKTYVCWSSEHKPDIRKLA